MSKVLFFLAASVPTVPEQALIDRLARTYTQVAVRAGDHSATYGPRLESADAVAGTVPAAFITAIADYPDGNVTPTNVLKPEAALILPAATPTIGVGATLQLRAVAAERNEATNAITLTDRTAAAEVAWSSSDDTKATVASTGIVTRVATGAVVITWTYTYDTAVTITATRNVTLS